MRIDRREDELVDVREDHCHVVPVMLRDGRSLRLDTAELLAEDENGLGKCIGIGSNKGVCELVPLLS